MEAMFAGSRSIIHNQTYKKTLQKQFQNHKKTLQKLRTTMASEISGEDCANYLQNLHRFKSAHKAVQHIFDQRHIENRSLYKRLIQIQDDKKGKMGMMGKERDRVRSEVMESRVIHIENWEYRRDEERRRIQKENLVIKRKIDEQRKNMMTVSKLRKQFKEHDRLFNHAKKFRV